MTSESAADDGLDSVAARTIPLRHLAVPASVRHVPGDDGGRIVWRWGESVKTAIPTPTLLWDFSEIADGPSAAAFASRWGTIGACAHGLPATHRQRPSPWAASPLGFAPPWCEPHREADGSYSEPVALWRDLAALVNACLEIGPRLRPGGAMAADAWAAVLPHWLAIYAVEKRWREAEFASFHPSRGLFVFIPAAPLVADPMPPRAADRQRADLARLLNFLLLLGASRPCVEWAPGAGRSMTLDLMGGGLERVTGRPPHGLLGALAARLCAAIAGRRVQVECAGKCGKLSWTTTPDAPVSCGRPECDRAQDAARKRATYAAKKGDAYKPRAASRGPRIEPKPAKSRKEVRRG